MVERFTDNEKVEGPIPSTRTRRLYIYFSLTAIRNEKVEGPEIGSEPRIKIFFHSWRANRFREF